MVIPIFINKHEIIEAKKTKFFDGFCLAKRANKKGINAIIIEIILFKYEYLQNK